MKKIILIGLALALMASIFMGCSNDSNDIVTATTTESTTEFETITQTTTSWEDVSLSFPEEFIVNTHEYDAGDLGFERQFRMGFYRASGSYLRLGPPEEVDEWLRNVVQLSVGAERLEPVYFSFIKYFDVAFEDFRRVAIGEYLLSLEADSNMSHEGWEIPNPYLLFTFNLERINDYYSLDPARHTSARLWLEEWLQHNEPYASYSAFRAANP